MVDPYGLRVVSAELNFFGYGAGLFFDTGRDGTTLFEGISDVGVFVDRPTEGLSAVDISDLTKKLRASARFTHAPTRCSFDADKPRFNANLALLDLTTDTERTTFGLGVNVPIPVTEVEDRTVNSLSVGDIIGAIGELFE